MALSGVFNAGVDAVVTFVPEALNGYSDFRIGGLSGVSMAQLLPALCLIAPGILIALSLHNELDVLALGREKAQALGLSARPMRLVFLALTAALAGAAVSFAGLLAVSSTHLDSPVMAISQEAAQAYDDTLKPMEKKHMPSQEEFYIMSQSFLGE